MDTTDTSFTDHVIAFGRALRRLGFHVGPSHITTALEAVSTVGITRKDDVKAALKLCFVQHKEELELFDQAFHLFWKAPSRMPEVMKWLLQTTHVPNSVESKGYNRVQEALSEKPKQETPQPDEDSGASVELDQIVTYSPSEILRKKDFAAFTNEEISAAKTIYAETIVAPSSLCSAAIFTLIKRAAPGSQKNYPSRTENPRRVNSLAQKRPIVPYEAPGFAVRYQWLHGAIRPDAVALYVFSGSKTAARGKLRIWHSANAHHTLS